jgi:hypothetical protein
MFTCRLRCLRVWRRPAAAATSSSHPPGCCTSPASCWCAFCEPAPTDSHCGSKRSGSNPGKPQASRSNTCAPATTRHSKACTSTTCGPTDNQAAAGPWCTSTWACQPSTSNPSACVSTRAEACCGGRGRCQATNCRSPCSNYHSSTGHSTSGCCCCGGYGKGIAIQKSYQAAATTSRNCCCRAWPARQQQHPSPVLVPG